MNVTYPGRSGQMVLILCLFAKSSNMTPTSLLHPWPPMINAGWPVSTAPYSANPTRWALRRPPGVPENWNVWCTLGSRNMSTRGVRAVGLVTCSLISMVSYARFNDVGSSSCERCLAGGWGALLLGKGVDREPVGTLTDGEGSWQRKSLSMAQVFSFCCCVVKVDKWGERTRGVGSNSNSEIKRERESKKERERESDIANDSV